MLAPKNVLRRFYREGAEQVLTWTCALHVTSAELPSKLGVGIVVLTPLIEYMAVSRVQRQDATAWEEGLGGAEPVSFMPAAAAAGIALGPAARRDCMHGGSGWGGTSVMGLARKGGRGRNCMHVSRDAAGARGKAIVGSLHMRALRE